MDSRHVTLRPADDGDRLFAFRVKEAALRRYVESLWGWDDEVQVAFHGADWAERRPEIVRLFDRDIGTIEIWRRGEDIHLGEFYLLPDFQGGGIGSQLMTRLTREADAENLPVRLEVMRINPARSLYERFGFKITGETKTHFLMERLPRKVLNG